MPPGSAAASDESDDEAAGPPPETPARTPQARGGNNGGSSGTVVYEPVAGDATPIAVRVSWGYGFTAAAGVWLRYALTQWETQSKVPSDTYSQPIKRIRSPAAAAPPPPPAEKQVEYTMVAHRALCRVDLYLFVFFNVFVADFLVAQMGAP